MTEPAHVTASAGDAAPVTAATAVAAGIGILGESSLHASLKAWYARPGDSLETLVDGFVIDIVGDDRLVEIQTGNFTAIRPKLERLLAGHRLLLVHPIARERWIVRTTADGEVLGRRKSSQRGRVEDVFRQLVRLPHLLSHPNLTLEVALIQEEQVLRDDGRGSWRRGRWSVYDRRLLAVVETRAFATPGDLAALLPSDLPRPFTNRDLAAALHCRPDLARKMTYSLQRMGVLARAGKQGSAILYEAAAPS